MNEYDKIPKWDEYTDWLIDRILIDHDWPNNGRYSYNELMLRLNCYECRFIWDVGHDRNRISDGIQLRSEYFGGRYADIPCSFLEMLVALAIRMDCEYIGDPGEPNPGKIFWEMIRNMGMNCLDDMKIWSRGMVLDDIVEKFMRREYDDSGRGGLFPLRNPKTDQRSVEIWSQMLAYISENY